MCTLRRVQGKLSLTKRFCCSGTLCFKTWKHICDGNLITVIIRWWAMTSCHQSSHNITFWMLHFGPYYHSWRNDRNDKGCGCAWGVLIVTHTPSLNLRSVNTPRVASLTHSFWAEGDICHELTAFNIGWGRKRVCCNAVSKRVHMVWSSSPSIPLGYTGIIARVKEPLFFDVR
jgi:hypothetical protein